MKRHPAISCGTCHECGHVLSPGRDSELMGGDGLPGEWCPDCGALYRYRSHGYSSRTRQVDGFAGSRRSSRCGLIEPRKCDRCLFPELLTQADEGGDTGPDDLPVTVKGRRVYQAGLLFD